MTISRPALLFERCISRTLEKGSSLGMSILLHISEAEPARDSNQVVVKDKTEVLYRSLPGWPAVFYEWSPILSLSKWIAYI